MSGKRVYETDVHCLWKVGAVELMMDQKEDEDEDDGSDGDDDCVGLAKRTCALQIFALDIIKALPNDVEDHECVKASLLLSLRFIARVPATTSPERLQRERAQPGLPHLRPNPWKPRYMIHPPPKATSIHRTSLPAPIRPLHVPRTFLPTDQLFADPVLNLPHYSHKAQARRASPLFNTCRHP